MTDGKRIGAKTQALAKLTADQRLAFIRAVGDAARVLDDNQRSAVLGHTQAISPATPAPMPAAGMENM